MAPGKNSCVENQFPLVLDEKGATLLAWGYAGLGRVGISIETKRQGGMTLPKPYYHDERSGITIYNGDCREILPYLPKVDLVLTDPPYGIGFGKKHTKWSENRGTILGDWDCEIPDIEWILPHGEFVVVWGGERFALPKRRGWLAWIKPDAPPTFASFELAWTNLDRPARWIQHSISATNAERVGHPTQKPLRVISWCIKQVCPDAKTIIDPFMGSGTTLRAAKDLGRKAIGIEIEEKYCEIAVKRLSQEVLPGV